MRFIAKSIALSAMGIAVFLAATAHADSGNTLEVVKDRKGVPMTGGLPPCAAMQAYITSAMTMVSLTLPAGTTDVKFYPPDTGSNTYSKANGGGKVCTKATNITDGTACEKNRKQYRLDLSVSGTAILGIGATSDVTGSTVTYCPYNRSNSGR